MILCLTTLEYGNPAQFYIYRWIKSLIEWRHDKSLDCNTPPSSLRENLLCIAWLYKIHKVCIVGERNIMYMWSDILSNQEGRDEQDDEQSVKEEPFGANKNIHTLNSFRTGSSRKVKSIHGRVFGFSSDWRSYVLYLIYIPTLYPLYINPDIFVCTKRLGACFYLY